MVTTQSQSEHTSDSQQDEAEEQKTAQAEPASSPKRETRGSKHRPTNKQPETTHEADVSESESCCSVASDMEQTSRSRRRTTVRAKHTAVDEQEASKAESSSSSLGKTPRRSTRGQKKPVPLLESTTSQEDERSEAESCSSVASLSTRTTRSRRKPVVAAEDATHSEADSCSSAVSGPQVSTVRRSTRSRVKVTEPIPIHLEQSETTEASSAVESRRTLGRRGKAKPAEEDQAYDSEGCQSGPSLSPRRTTRGRVADSDSESPAYTSLDSPCSTRDRGTPCSSRTGSASSNCAVRVTRSRSVKVVVDVLSVVSKSVKKDSTKNEPEKDQAETTEDIPCLSVSATKSDMDDVEEMEEDANNETVIAADEESPFTEDKNGDFTLTLNEDEAEVIKCESSQDILSETEKDVGECQQIIDEAMETHQASSVEEVQAMEEESSSISVTQRKSVTGTQDPDTVIQQSSDPVKHEENVKVLGQPKEASREMKHMAADASTITLASTASSSLEVSKMSIEKTKAVKGCVSLLDSSENEESDDDGLSVDGGNDEAEDLENEDETCCSEDQPGPSSAPDTHTGNELFVIDARPGCQPSEKYYIDTTHGGEDANVEDSKADEDEEDFVDEEGDDDEEEDEDTKVLFTTRKPALYEFDFASSNN